MHIHPACYAFGLPAVGAAMHALAVIIRRRRAPQPLKGTTMSETTTAPAAAPAPPPVEHEDFTDEVLTSVSDAAEWALHGLQHLGTEWAAIKASPVYGPVAEMAKSMATAELATLGIQPGPLVNVAKASEAALEMFAALHPTIATP